MGTLFTSGHLFPFSDAPSAIRRLKLKLGRLDSSVKRIFMVALNDLVD